MRNWFRGGLGYLMNSELSSTRLKTLPLEIDHLKNEQNAPSIDWLRMKGSSSYCVIDFGYSSPFARTIGLDKCPASSFMDDSIRQKPPLTGAAAHKNKAKAQRKRLATLKANAKPVPYPDDVDEARAQDRRGHCDGDQRDCRFLGGARYVFAITNIFTLLRN